MINTTAFAPTNGTESRHQCIVYKGSPSQKLPFLAAILKSKLSEGYRCLYLNSAPMVTGMRSTLAAMDVDLAKVTNDSLIFSSDPVSSGNDFNSQAMLARLENLLDDAIKDGYKGLWASGDMTWEFGPSKDFSKLMEYELGIEELLRRRTELCGICQYHHDTLPQDAMRQSLLMHQTVLISDTLKIINPYYLKSNWPTDQNANVQLDEMIAELCRE